MKTYEVSSTFSKDVAKHYSINWYYYYSFRLSTYQFKDKIVLLIPNNRMNLKKSKSSVPLSIKLKNRIIVYVLFFVVGGSLLSIHP
jgi:hypothetical protein